MEYTISGIVLYILGCLGIAYIILTKWVIMGATVSLVIAMVLWSMLTIGVGTVLIYKGKAFRNDKK